MKKDLDLVKIISFLFFDGHLYKDLTGFYFSSKDVNVLKELDKIVQGKFEIKGKFYYNDGGAGRTKTHKYRVFSAKICRDLLKLGVPRGSKTITDYLIPKWILKNKRLSKEFVKVAYFCEGSMKENRKNPRIRITMNKSEILLSNGIQFMEQIRKILRDNRIETTDIGIYSAKTRKDNIAVKELRFRVLTKYNNRFIKVINPFLMWDGVTSIMGL